MAWIHFPLEWNHLWCLVYQLKSVGALKMKFVAPIEQINFPCNLRCQETHVKSLHFGLLLSRYRPVLIYDMDGQKFHWPCSGLKVISTSTVLYSKLYFVWKAATFLWFYECSKSRKMRHFEALQTKYGLLDMYALLTDVVWGSGVHPPPKSMSKDLPRSGKWSYIYINVWKLFLVLCVSFGLKTGGLSM